MLHSAETNILEDSEFMSANNMFEAKQPRSQGLSLGKLKGKALETRLEKLFTKENDTKPEHKSSIRADDR